MIWIPIVSAAIDLAACGSTRGTGHCRDKPLLDLCSPGFQSACETTKDGCEQCSCMPISDDQGRPLRDP